MDFLWRCAGKSIRKSARLDRRGRFEHAPSRRDTPSPGSASIHVSPDTADDDGHDVRLDLTDFTDGSASVPQEIDDRAGGE